MSAPTPLRQDFDASQLRGLARKTKDGPQCSQPLPHRGMEPPKAQMCDADHRRARRGLLYQRQQTHTREHVMTWTSDRAGVVFYTVLGMLIVLSSIYIPA